MNDKKENASFRERIIKTKTKRLSSLAIFLLVILPLIFIGGYLCVRYFNIETDTALSRREPIATLGASLLKQKFDGIIDVGTSLVLRPLVYQNIEKGNWDEAIMNLEGISQKLPYIDSIILYDKEGMLKAIIPPIPEMVEKNFAYRDYYQGVSNKWTPYVSEVFKRASSPRYNVVSIAVPIQSQNQNVLGFILIVLRVDLIVDWGDALDVGSAGAVYIVDKNGQFVTHPHIGSESTSVNYSSFIVTQKVLRGEHGVGVFFDPVDNDEDVVAYAPVGEYGFGVMVAQPTDVAFAERNSQVLGLIAVFASAMLIIGFSLHYLLRDRDMIRAQRDRERILFESVGDGIIAINRDWNITMWNKAAVVITGWKEEEVMGKPFRSVVKFIREHDRTESITFIEDAMVMGVTSFMDFGMLLERKDGSEIPVSDSASPVINDNGQADGAIIIFRDASKEKETMHLRSDFAYASHQLRTPITGALWNLTLAREEEDPEKREESLRVVEGSLQSIQRLSEHLVDASEIDQGSISVKKSAVKIMDVFDEIQRTLEDKMKKYGVALSFGQLSVLAAFDTDPKLFKKALLEVIENAILYSPEGAEVKVNTTATGKNILFEINNTGNEIPEAEQPIVFTKFFRASNHPANVPGSGLGLYLAREYVRALGGRIWFESEEGKGTTFSVSLPIE